MSGSVKGAADASGDSALTGPARVPGCAGSCVSTFKCDVRGLG